jgi:Fuc2NAc and GlcNAc transferase
MFLDWMGVAATFVLAAGCAFGLTALVVKIARARGWTDRPGQVSSHVTPTPTRGGVAVVLLSSAAAIALNLPVDGAWPLWVWLSGLWSLAIVGFVDDVHPLAVTPRLVVHFFAAGLGLFALGYGDAPAWIGVLMLLALVWCVNFFNFMDGLDGMLASNTALICLAAAAFCYQSGMHSQAFFWLVVAAVTLGFLALNWAPAKIFLGDTGSGPIGFLIGTGLTHSVASGAFSAYVAIILLSPLLCDATVTLIRRIWWGENWYQGHRTHAYQILSRRWASHQRVVLAWVVGTTVWVLPGAVLAQANATMAPVISVAVLAVNCAVVFWLGAGLAEPRSEVN